MKKLIFLILSIFISSNYLVSKAYQYPNCPDYPGIWTSGFGCHKPDSTHCERICKQQGAVDSCFGIPDWVGQCNTIADLHCACRFRS